MAAKFLVVQPMPALRLGAGHPYAARLLHEHSDFSASLNATLGKKDRGMLRVNRGPGKNCPRGRA